MKYHKRLKREELIKYGWRRLLMMAASEFSRAESLSNNGGGKELRNCLLRAKELFGVLETDPSIPALTAQKLLLLTKELLTPLKANPGSLYNKAMRLAS